MPKELAPAPRLESNAELRALEHFFHKTAPQLAGYFEGGFFQGSILHTSLVEPVVRNAIAAVSALDEEITYQESSQSGTLDRYSPSPSPNHSIKLYNKAIRTVIEKADTDPHATWLIAMANVLFICFEYYRGNRAMAKAHVKSGIQILQSWSQKNIRSTTLPWGHKYESVEAYFMSMEIAPVLSTFRAVLMDKHVQEDAPLILNPIDDNEEINFGDRFDTIKHSKVALVDLITYTAWKFDQIVDPEPTSLHLTDEDICIIDKFERGFAHWKLNFEALVCRHGPTWDYSQKEASEAVRVLELTASFGLRSLMAESECTWDNNRMEYVQGLQCLERLLGSGGRFSNNRFRPFRLDFGLLFALHPLAWKCRWPRLRRQGLDFLKKLPGHDWILSSERYYTIFYRIMELEEAHLGLQLGEIPPDDLFLPEHVRIHHFSVAPTAAGDERTYAVSFWSKPQGLDGPWHSVVENIQLGSYRSDRSAIPMNLLSHYLAVPRKLRPLLARSLIPHWILDKDEQK